MPLDGEARNLYRAYEPLDVLKEVARDVWIVDGPEIRFRLGPLKLPFPTRMTVVRLPSGGLWLHSPIAWNETLANELVRLGAVAQIVAPNTIHYWWVGDWSRHFPAAQVWAVPHLDRGAETRVPSHHKLGATAPAAWEDAFDQVMLVGARITEADFYHRASSTLILADLIENFERERFRSAFYRWLAQLGGTVDPDGQLPRDLRRNFAKQRAAFRNAIAQMIEWSPERIILAHGRWYAANGADELRRAFRWLT
jgi:hypothetical protein